MARQVALIARWNEKATDLGTRLLALSCFDNNRFVNGRNAIEDDVMSFESLRLEITTEVIDLLHEYCFILRKLIERANCVSQAKKLYPHQGEESISINKDGPDERKVMLCQKDLWWILGRVIHSQSVVVLGGDTNLLRIYSDGKTRSYSDGYCYASVESDFDDGVQHILHIPSLVHVFSSSALASEIKEVVRENTI